MPNFIFLNIIHHNYIKTEVQQIELLHKRCWLIIVIKMVISNIEKLSIICYNNFIIIKERCYKQMGVHKKNRLGETKMMNCGMKATIIKYDHCRNLAIKYEDGTIVTNKTYALFKSGSIKNPNLRLGEKRLMNCGEYATIIAYRCNLDIDVCFEDGTVVKNRVYGEFTRGIITNPNKHRNKRIGETNTMSCGMKATIIEYRTTADIDVQFENGEVKAHTSYGQFKTGNILPPNHHIGEIRLQHNGLYAEIVDYVRIRDLTIRFEDGFEVPHVAYDNFKTGYISHPGLCRKKDAVFHGFKTRLAYRDDEGTYYTCRCNYCKKRSTMTPQQMLAHDCPKKKNK